jgi:hypothetical protein
MDSGMLGGVIGGALGLLGGVVGTYWSNRRQAQIRTRESA